MDSKKEKTICNLSKLNGILIPRDILFYESEDKSSLLLTMTLMGLKSNMQNDGAAFEAWALVGKSKGYKKVKLSIDELFSVEELNDNEILHYNRFLYRVYNFKNIFNWFEISENLENSVHAFINKFFSGDKLIYNVPKKSKSISKENSEKKHISENDMEKFFCSNPDITNDILGIDAKEYFYQLPVGLFYKEKKGDKEHRIFTGGHSDIDFWSITNDILNIIELKIGDNNGLGVLSEIFFYVCLMRDFHIKKIAESSEITNYRGFDRIKDIKKIRAFILLEKEHTLLKDAYQEIKKISENDKTIYFADNIKKYDPRDYFNI